MEVENTRRLVLLGKTGAGKSSIANMIFGEKNVFKASGLANSQTKTCQAKNKRINGRNICLVDTPGLFDTDLNSSELSSEILRSIQDCAPGPHAFLLVLKVERYTKQEQAVVDEIINYFSEDALKYTTVVFTHGNELPEGMRIAKWTNENKSLRKLVDKCGGRCHVFDNKYWNNQVQVKELLETIDKTVTDNGGEYYTNEILQNIKHLSGKISEKRIPVRILLGALLGVVGVGGLLVAGFIPFSVDSLAYFPVAAFLGGFVGWVFTPNKEKEDPQHLKKTC